MEKPERRPISLAGLGLISAGAVLGLALATPAQAAPAAETSGRPPVVQQDRPER
jgi:uncharacterized protein (DUF1501 family)